jgi:hemerythrin-like domain-containing protein/rubredoxin
MEPIGLLMMEHRVIERMVNALSIELAKERMEKTVNFPFLDVAIDFFRTYADRCHHGKEENILFRELSKKTLADEHNRMMKILVQEHDYGRKTVSNLLNAKEMFAQGYADALDEIAATLERLTTFYPSHIEKEDKQFFHQCMEYFTEQEREAMMREFHRFDESLIHERYREIAENALTLVRPKDFTKWKCTVCEYVYIPTKGDLEHGIRPGTPFSELPDDWTCPVCFAKKDAFKPIE